MESAILLRIKHFQECAGWVAFVVRTDFVYLIQDKHRVAGLHFSQVLNDTTRHSTNIGATVTTQLCLVVQTTETDTRILATEGFGDRATKTGFTHTRRAIEAEDRGFHIVGLAVGFHLQHRQVFNDTLLHFLHAIVVMVKYCLCVTNIVVVFGVFVPRQVEQDLQVVL